MSSETDAKKLIRAARQLVETEKLFGAEFMPAQRNPLPACEPVDAARRGALTGRQKAEALEALKTSEV